MDYEVFKEVGTERFVAADGDEELGFLSYREDGTSVTIEHTVVQPQHRGRGVAAALAEHALRRLAEANGKRIVPQCSYIRDYIARHPEHAPLTRR